MKAHRQNKNIKKIIVIDGIIFLVSGLITALIGKFTADSYGTILILCGLVPMVSGIVSNAGPRHHPMPYSYRRIIFLAKQQEREKKEMLADTSSLLILFVIGIILIVIGLILKHYDFTLRRLDSEALRLLQRWGIF